MNELLSKLQELDPGTYWGAIGAVFGMMDVAEDEITKAQARNPAHNPSKRIWAGFKLLCPSIYLNGVPEPVYRNHCAELLDRVAQGLDTTLGTKAEIMMGLSSSSLKAPLTHTAAVLYARIFQGIYPDSLDAVGRQLADMAFGGTTGALLAELSKKCRDPERKLAHTKSKEAKHA